MMKWLDDLRADVRYAARQPLWVPVAFTAERLAEHDEHFLTAVARLAPGVSLEQARAELQAIYRQMRAELPGETQVRLGVVTTLVSQLVGDVRGRLLVLFGAVTFVLLIACGTADGNVRGRDNGAPARCGSYIPRGNGS
jgi:hypothetical protein